MGPGLINILSSGAGKRRRPGRIKKILVVRPGGIGDAALLLPVLREILLLHPEIKMDILCESRNMGVFQAAPFISSIWLYHNPFSLMALLFKNYDAIVDTEQSHFLSAILVRILFSGFKLGFQGRGRGRMFHLALPYDQGEYEAVVFRNLFKNCFPLSQENPGLNIFSEQSGEDEKYKKIFPASFQKPIVCLFPGASIQERLWSLNRWVEIAEWLIESGFQPVILGGSREKAICSAILLQAADDSIWNMAGKLSLLQTVRLFRKTRLLISTDSGILHLAVISGVKTLSLFGPGMEIKWAPRGQNHGVINKNLPCSPCTRFGNTPPCSSKACMQAISTDDVKIAAQCLLDEESYKN